MSANRMKPTAGLVYWVRVADDPQEYRALCLRDPTPALTTASWFIYDGNNQTGRAAAGRYVVVDRPDLDHAASVIRSASLLLERS